jgi:hypothetical protein
MTLLNKSAQAVMLVQVSSGSLTNLTEVCLVVRSASRQMSAAVVSQVRLCDFCGHPVKLVTHKPFYHMTLCNLSC